MDARTWAPARHSSLGALRGPKVHAQWALGVYKSALVAPGLQVSSRLTSILLRVRTEYGSFFMIKGLHTDF